MLGAAPGQRARSLRPVALHSPWPETPQYWVQREGRKASRRRRARPSLRSIRCALGGPGCGSEVAGEACGVGGRQDARPAQLRRQTPAATPARLAGDVSCSVPSWELGWHRTNFSDSRESRKVARSAHQPLPGPARAPCAAAAPPRSSLWSTGLTERAGRRAAGRRRRRRWWRRLYGLQAVVHAFPRPAANWRPGPEDACAPPLSSGLGQGRDAPPATPRPPHPTTRRCGWAWLGGHVGPDREEAPAPKSLPQTCSLPVPSFPAT